MLAMIGSGMLLMCLFAIMQFMRRRAIGGRADRILATIGIEAADRETRTMSQAAIDRLPSFVYKQGSGGVAEAGAGLARNAAAEPMLDPRAPAMLDHTCVVCLEDFEAGDVVRALPCRHAFHADCIDQWLLTRRACCPVCKRCPVDDNNSTSGGAVDGAGSGRNEDLAMHTPHNGIEDALRAVSGGGMERSVEMAVFESRTSTSGAVPDGRAAPVTVSVAASETSAMAHLPDNSVLVVTESAASHQSARI